MRSRWLLPVSIVGGAVLLTFLLIGSRPAPPKKESTAREPLVEVTPAREFAGEFTLMAQGSVSPRTSTTLVSEVNGAVMEVSDAFNVGGFFRKGDVLLRIDDKDYDAALRRAEAQVANRQALLSQEQARADQARKDWETLKRPGQPSELVLRVPYVAEAQANLRSAQADLQQAQINLRRTVIRAPYDGLLREKRVDVGQYVSTGTQLALLNSIDTAEVRLPLTEHDAAFVQLPVPGQADGVSEVTLRAEVAGAAVSWPARLIRSENVIDERSRVVYAVAAVDDPYGVLGTRSGPPLMFGTFVQAELSASIGHSVVAVPRHAVRGSNQVMTVDAENKLRLRQIDIVRSNHQHAFVEGGIAAGEQVVVSTLEAPVDGMPVRVSEATLLASADTSEPATALPQVVIEEATEVQPAPAANATEAADTGE